MPSRISSRRRRLATVASATLALSAASAAFSAPAHAAPANDSFANATAIGSSYYDYVYAGGATSESGEPSHAGVAPGATLWYSWTAPTDMKVSLTGYAYNFDYNYTDTAVAVYTGSSLTALTPVVSQNASNWNTSFTAVGGRTYRIALSGPFGDTYRFSWSLNATPKNDPFAAPKVITGSTGTHNGSNVNATLQASEPQHVGLNGGASVWYSWTAPSTGQHTFSTGGSGFDTLLGVYRGTSITALTEVASNDDCESSEGVSTSCVVVDAVSGTNYRIAVDGYNGSTGALKFAYAAGAEAPIGPSCTITGTSGNDVLVGTAGADYICGLEGDDQIKGLGGNDTIVGGDGVDAASFADSSAAVTANLTTGTATGEGTDNLQGVENLIGSAHSDKLDGDANANVLNGGAGSDGLWGQGGNDTLFGGDGDDTLGGTAGNDKLVGGSGSDTAHFGKAAGITANLGTGTSTGEGTDSLSAVENIMGSPGSDRLTGTTGVNLFQGGGGADNLSGAGGNDSLYGSSGNDTLTGGAGIDLCDGGTNTDTATTCETKVAIP